MEEPNAPGVISVAAEGSVADVADRFATIAGDHGLTVFARVDHHAAAAAAGVEMQEAQVVFVGNPKAGTPIMIAAPLVALELPLRVLVWADSDGATWISFTDPDWTAERFGVEVDGLRPLQNLVDAARQ